MMLLGMVRLPRLDLAGVSQHVVQRGKVKLPLTPLSQGRGKLMSQRLEIYVSYSQLAVFVAGLDQPFNNWTDKQVEDGYSWTPNSVSFKTPVDDGICLVEVMEAQERASSSKSIEVPFDIPDDGKIEVASISDGGLIEIRAGKSTLRYEVVTESSLLLTFIYE